MGRLRGRLADWAGGALAGRPGKALEAQELSAFFDQLIPQQLQAEHVAGASVAVVQDGEIRFTQGYGYANVAQQTPVRADQTLFFFASWKLIGM